MPSHKAVYKTKGDKCKGDWALLVRIGGGAATPGGVKATLGAHIGIAFGCDGHGHKFVGNNFSLSTIPTHIYTACNF